MIRSSVDLPLPFAPSTPILAPGYIEMLMPFRTSRSGGWNRARSRMVKMNCGAIPRKYRPHVLERVGAWDVGRVAAGVVTAAAGVVETWGDVSSPFALASVTKLL